MGVNQGFSSIYPPIEYATVSEGRFPVSLSTSCPCFFPESILLNILRQRDSPISQQRVSIKLEVRLVGVSNAIGPTRLASIFHARGSHGIRPGNI